MANMKNLMPQQLLEIDRCFQYVLDCIKADDIEPRSILFGSTVDNWFRAVRGERPTAKIVVVGTPPNSKYERAYLRSDN